MCDILINLRTYPGASDDKFVPLEKAVNELLGDEGGEDADVFGFLTKGAMRTNALAEMVCRMIEVMARDEKRCDSGDVSYILTDRHVDIARIERG